jgi:hypothetical protein
VSQGNLDVAVRHGGRGVRTGQGSSVGGLVTVGSLGVGTGHRVALV